jgi:hypothetical protein
MAWQFESIQQNQLKAQILIGVPYKQRFSDKFQKGLLSLRFPEMTGHMIMWETGQPVDVSRNIMVSAALQNNCTHLFFVDQDIILEPDTLIHLIEQQLPLVGSVYYARSDPYPVVATINQVALSHDTVKEKLKNASNGRAIMEVHEIGMGATLIDTRVFKRIAMINNMEWLCMLRHPHIEQLKELEKDDNMISFTNDEAIRASYRCPYCNNTLIAKFFEYRIGKYKTDALSEDYYFCKLVRKAGFSVYLALHTEVGHELSTMVLNGDGLLNTTTSAGVVN